MASAPLLKRQSGGKGSKRDSLSDDIVKRAFQLCKDYLGEPWTFMSRKDFQLTPLGGGLTNKLYTCKLLSSEEHGHKKSDSVHYPTTVLLRIYGLILQDFKAQIQESVVFSILAERSIGPRLFGVFPGGRLEEYLPSRTLKTSDLSKPEFSRNIAIRLAEYHRLVMPVKKDPTFITSKLLHYLEKTNNAHFEDMNEQAMFEKFMKYDVNKEVAFIKDMIAELNPVVVFCHNDVQEGNLLHTEASENDNFVQMIDFEYSSYNYRGFDFGNHFCEWIYDYSHQSWPFFLYKKENFPTREEQLYFTEAYLESMYAAIPSRKHDKRWSVECIMHETQRLTLLSHLFWALWSIRQAQISDIKFGYLEYALVRMESYYEHKKEID